MTYGRKRLVTVLVGTALAASVGLVPNSPAHADPDIDSVQARVDVLYHEAEQASERYNDAKLELSHLKGDVGSLRADERRQHGDLDAARKSLRNAIVGQYGAGDLSAVQQLVTSHGTESLVSDLSTIATYNQIQHGLYDDYATGVKALGLRRNATQKRLDQVSATKARLASEKSTIDQKLTEAKSLLDRLKDEEREQILSRGSVRMPSDVPASGRAAAAIHYAMAQVGKAYVFGAAGPSAFDCSGLTMMAWAQAGVALPHSSSAQSATGRHVSSGELQPGDLVFYYSPISHVAMYIGNGLIVGAANPGAGVRVSGVFSMPYSGAVRPG